MNAPRLTFADLIGPRAAARLHAHNRANLLDRETIGRSYACARDYMERAHNFRAIGHKDLSAQWVAAAMRARSLAHAAMRSIRTREGAIAGGDA